jgi:hypothetical protein
MDRRQIPIEYLHECFDYDPDTGALVWRERPLSHFKNAHGMNIFNAKNAGNRAGKISRGRVTYIDVAITYRGHQFRFGAHRVAFAMKQGRWPSEGLEIDHLDGDGTNNRAANLREATRLVNAQNFHRKGLPASGFLGVAKKRDGRWYAMIRSGGRYQNLGTYPTPEEASAAYERARAERHATAPAAALAREKIQAGVLPEPKRLQRKLSVVGLRGVQASHDLFSARIKDGDRTLYLGVFTTPEEASAAVEAGKASIAAGLSPEVKKTPRSTGMSGFRGARRNGEKFQALITVKGKYFCLGAFENAEHAHAAWVMAASHRTQLEQAR